MYEKLYYSLIILITCFTGIKTNQMTYLKTVESFDALNLLIGIKKHNTTSLCGRDVAEFLNDLSLEKYWASEMYDASAKIPNGLLRGNLINMGQFDECLDVQNPSGQFTGQHCMLRVNLTSKVDKKLSNIYRVIRPYEEINKYDKFWRIQYGICVPSTCTVSDISKGVNAVLNNEKSEEIISVIVDEKNCRIKDQQKISDTDWAAIGILAAFCVLALLSTIYDLWHHYSPQEKKPHQLLQSFSLYTNGKTLFQISNSSEQLKPLHGIRVLSMYWIILLHAYEYVWTLSPVVNFFDFTESSQDITLLPIYNGFISVDTFFFLSGMLVCIVFFRDMEKKGFYDVPLSYIHRYIRLTPSYGFMILITAHIFIHLGDGPFWNSINGPQMENCKEYWWSAILYIQNFINPDQMCVSVSWYLSTDMQFYWFAPIVLYLIYYLSNYAALVFGLAIVTAVCTNFGIAFTNNLGANHITHSDYKFQFETDYIQFYMRAAPYIIGIAMGYVVCKIRRDRLEIKLNKFSVVIGWLTATGLCLLAIYGSEPFTKNKLSTLEGVFFLCLHRVAWGIGISWIVFACLYGYGGPVNGFLSWNFLQPLSKLTYNVFFIHRAVQYYRFGNYRTNTYAGDYEVTNDFFGDLIFSHLIAIPFTLLFEIPFGNLYRYFFKGVKIFPWPRPAVRADSTETQKIDNVDKLEN